MHVRSARETAHPVDERGDLVTFLGAVFREELGAVDDNPGRLDGGCEVLHAMECTTVHQRMQEFFADFSLRYVLSRSAMQKAASSP